VERRCADLTRRSHFLHVNGVVEWPDGTVATCYQFLHALYQEVVYEQVPLGRRVQLHRRLGEREEIAYGGRAREIAAELAVHFERGRNCRKAVQYLQQAGENAVRRSAHQEAIPLLTKGLELLKTLPDTPERAQQELHSLITLGPALISLKGYTAAEVGRTYARARELCRQLGETPQLFPVLHGLWSFYLVRAEHVIASELAERLLTLSQREQDSVLLLEAHGALAESSFWLGELTTAQAYGEQSIACYAPQRYDFLPSLYGGARTDIENQCITASILWHLGYVDQAVNRVSEALALAEESAHPFSQAVALTWAASLYKDLRKGQQVQKLVEILVVLCLKHGFTHWLAVGTFDQGWVLAEQGKYKEGIAQMAHGLAAHQVLGAALARPYLLAQFAEAYGKTGQLEEGLSALAEALKIVCKNGERVYEAELYRLKGELTLQQFQVSGSKFHVSTNQKTRGRGKKQKATFPSTQHVTPSTQAEAEVEVYFQKAIEIARRQQAKSLELRATMSLARLWQRQGKQHAARNTLAEIYGWFTEGFDTKDLQEAKALLQELNA
jgi:predicted ATPase